MDDDAIYKYFLTLEGDSTIAGVVGYTNVRIDRVVDDFGVRIDGY